MFFFHNNLLGWTVISWPRFYFHYTPDRILSHREFSRTPSVIIYCISALSLSNLSTNSRTYIFYSFSWSLYDSKVLSQITGFNYAVIESCIHQFEHTWWSFVTFERIVCYVTSHNNGNSIDNTTNDNGGGVMLPENTGVTYWFLEKNSTKNPFGRPINVRAACINHVP